MLSSQKTRPEPAKVIFFKHPKLVHWVLLPFFVAATVYNYSNCTAKLHCFVKVDQFVLVVVIVYQFPTQTCLAGFNIETASYSFHYGWALYQLFINFLSTCLSTCYQLLSTFLSTFYQLYHFLSTLYQLFINFLSAFINFFNINFLSFFINLLSTLSTFYQPFINFINFFQLFINFLSTFYQLFINL